MGNQRPLNCCAVSFDFPEETHLILVVYTYLQISEVHLLLMMILAEQHCPLVYGMIQ